MATLTEDELIDRLTQAMRFAAFIVGEAPEVDMAAIGAFGVLARNLEIEAFSLDEALAFLKSDLCTSIWTGERPKPKLEYHGQKWIEPLRGVDHVRRES